jgi:16S rRNA (guanine527-N7)-methyltransferase
VTEEEAQEWLKTMLSVPRETMDRLDQLRERVIAENSRQNLVSMSSIDQFWVRHIVDSAQLLLHTDGKNWLDLGTGAGFPGLVIAILRPDMPITLVESRRKRIDFLAATVAELGLPEVAIHGGRLETMKSAPFQVISARAFAPLHRLLPLAHSFSTADTVWLLPKGLSAREEVDAVKSAWSGMFHVKQSLTDANSALIVATKVAKKGRR